MADEPDGEKKPLVAVFGKFGVCRSEQLIKITFLKFLDASDKEFICSKGAALLLQHLFHRTASDVSVSS